MTSAIVAGLAGVAVAFALTAPVLAQTKSATAEKARAQLQEPARATTKMVQGAYIRSASVSVVASTERRRGSTALDVVAN